MSIPEFFDIHTHIFPDRLAPVAVYNLGKFYDFPVLGKGTSENLADTCAANGIKGMLILLTSTNPRSMHAVNEGGKSMLEYMKNAGFDAFVFGGYHQDCENPERELEYAVENGLTGFKLHPDMQKCDIDDERFFPLYEFCRGKYPIYFHMGDNRSEYRYSEAKKLLKVLEKFPGLRVGAAHLGGYNAWDEATVLAGHPDVWFDTSSTISRTGPGKASELIHLFGPDRCMFGTDYPVVTAAEEIPLFMALDLTDEERRNIACINAKHFLM